MPSKSNQRWRKSYRGHYLYCYYAMKTRCRPIANGPYRGMYVMPREEWNTFLNETAPERARLYNAWKAANYPQRLTPSIDRINPKLGYLPANCRWVPQYINCQRGGTLKKRYVKLKAELDAADYALIRFQIIPQEYWTEGIREALTAYQRLKESA